MIQGKYRVWCNVSKRYYRPDEEIFIDQQGKVFWAPGDGDWLDITDYVDVEFFTGLHDKNGKEIYDEDIVKCVAGLYEWRGAVEIKQGGWVKWHTKNFDAKDGKYVFGEWNPYTKTGFIEGNTEVVGNVHENPELLTGGEGEDK